MQARRSWLLGVGLLLGLILLAAGIASSQEAPRMTIEQLKEMLGKPDVIVIDVRYGKDWTGSQEKIRGAVREDPQEATPSWAEKYPKDKTLVLYCA